MLRETIMNKVTVRLEVSAAEFRRLLKQPKPVSPGDAELEPSVAPIQLEPTMRLLALVALHDADARSWLLEEPWTEVLTDDPEAALLKKILGAELDPSNPATVGAFLTTLDASEEAAVSTLLGERAPENSMTIAHDCWRELERRKIVRKRDALMARQRQPNLPLEDAGRLHEEILALQKRLSDIARPLSPPL
jgi:DNA primase